MKVFIGWNKHHKSQASGLPFPTSDAHALQSTCKCLHVLIWLAPLQTVDSEQEVHQSSHNLKMDRWTQGTGLLRKVACLNMHITRLYICGVSLNIYILCFDFSKSQRFLERGHEASGAFRYRRPARIHDFCLFFILLRTRPDPHDSPTWEKGRSFITCFTFRFTPLAVVFPMPAPKTQRDGAKPRKDHLDPKKLCGRLITRQAGCKKFG